jgi:drug/metabolite transporter (DMT)-like permease
VFLDISSRWKSFGIVLILHITVYVSQMWVVSQILAPYTSSFKTASSLFAVILGGWFFQEKDLSRRFLAALIILFGVGLISFLG